MMAKRSVDILLVGKTGNGKSATANSIVGYKAFKSFASTQSVTKCSQIEFAEFEGRILKIVDGPGVGDTRLDTENAVKLVIDAMTFAVAANPTGYHAIVVVGRFGIRFTQEEIKAIQLLKEIFNADFIQNHGILIMTHGDHFNTENEDDVESFEEWISHQEGEIKDLLKECNGRVMLFNNRADEKQKKEQTRKLLALVDHLSANGQSYTSEIFNKGKATRDKLLRESKKVQLSEEALMECGLITQELARMKYDEPKITLEILKSLSQRNENLIQGIREQDQGTNQLSGAIRLADQLRESVNERTKDAKELLMIKEQMSQMEAELQIGRIRLEVEENRRKEEEVKQQKDKEMQVAREEEIKRKLDKQRKINKRLMKEKEEKNQKELDAIQSNYQDVKEEDSWTWGGVASALVGPIMSVVKWWWGV